MGQCRGCGADIEWFKTPSGANMPMQRIGPIYTIADGVMRKQTLEGGPFFVSHFNTCPKASDFSGKRRKRSQ